MSPGPLPCSYTGCKPVSANATERQDTRLPPCLPPSPGATPLRGREPLAGGSHSEPQAVEGQVPPRLLPVSDGTQAIPDHGCRAGTGSSHSHPPLRPLAASAQHPWS